MAPRIPVQETWLTGRTATERFGGAIAMGFDGLELRSKGDFQFRDRLPKLRAALAAGAVMPTA